MNKPLEQDLLKNPNIEEQEKLLVGEEVVEFDASCYNNDSKVSFYALN